MDIRKLCRETDAETVAEYLQMPMKRKGKYCYILCPGHERRLGKPDSTIGNAVLKDNGYYCWACATFVPTHEMVMEYTGCSSQEAYDIMAEAMGGKELFDGDGGTGSTLNLPKCRLTSEEARIIGLYPRSSVVLKTENGESISEGLYTLYRENPTAYYGLITKKAAASRKRYEYCKEHYGAVTSDLAYKVYDLLGSSFDHSVYKQLSRELDDRIEICERVYRIFSAAGAKGVAKIHPISK